MISLKRKNYIGNILEKPLLYNHSKYEAYDTYTNNMTTKHFLGKLR